MTHTVEYSAELITTKNHFIKLLERLIKFDDKKIEIEIGSVDLSVDTSMGVDLEFTLTDVHVIAKYEDEEVFDESIDCNYADELTDIANKIKAAIETAVEDYLDYLENGEEE